MKILAIGDIFGRPGRRAFRELLPGLIQKHHPDLVIANAENAAGGRGLTPKVADEILESPVDVLTAGNHIWEYDAIHPYFDTHPILRPHNTHESLPGRGWGVFASKSGVRVAVVSLQGVVYMEEKGEKAGSPFLAMDALIPELKSVSDLIVVDFHAEATSEKRALAWYLDGRVAALFGTHTHVQTADEEILPQGTAYISDIGMTGPLDSVIGDDAEAAIERFLTNMPHRLSVGKGKIALNGMLVRVDDDTGKALSIERIYREVE